MARVEWPWQRHADALAKVAGQWVAVDSVTGELLLADPSPWRLNAEVTRLELRDVTIFRVSRPDDMEIVGSGFDWPVR